MSQDYPTVPPKTAENQKVQVNLLIINMLCLIQVQWGRGEGETTASRCIFENPLTLPSPLLKGRGRIVRSLCANLRLRPVRRSLKLSPERVCYSLSPAEGERVRVRGQLGAAVRTGGGKRRHGVRVKPSQTSPVKAHEGCLRREVPPFLLSLARPQLTARTAASIPPTDAAIKAATTGTFCRTTQIVRLVPRDSNVSSPGITAAPTPRKNFALRATFPNTVCN